MDVEFKFIQPKKQIELSLNELKNQNNKHILIKSLPK